MKDEKSMEHLIINTTSNISKIKFACSYGLVYELDRKNKADQVAPLEQISIKYIDVIFLKSNTMTKALYITYLSREWVDCIEVYKGFIHPTTIHSLADLGLGFWGRSTPQLLDPAQRLTWPEAAQGPRKNFGSSDKEMATDSTKKLK